MLDARGQWFDTSEGRLYVESTKLLNVLVPADSTDAAMESVRQMSDTYKQRFDQQAVHTNLRQCAPVFLMDVNGGRLRPRQANTRLEPPNKRTPDSKEKHNEFVGPAGIHRRGHHG